MLERRVLLLAAVGVLTLGCGKVDRPEAAAPHQGQLSPLDQAANQRKDAELPPGAGEVIREVGSQQSAAIGTVFTSRRDAQDFALLQPLRTGWETEDFAERALRQLDRLAELLASPTGDWRSNLASIATSDVRCSALRPTGLATTYDDGLVLTRRAILLKEGASSQGHAGLGSAIENWLAACPGLPADRDLVAHFKVVDVRPSDAEIDSTVLVELESECDGSRLQCNAEWRCTWKLGDVKTPRLASISLTEYEEAQFTGFEGRWFVDATAQVIGKDAALWQQIGRGHHHWLQRIERSQRFDSSARNGLAIGDANGDGLDDVYLCQPAGLPNRLLLARRDGTATEQSSQFGVDWLDHTSSALFCDLDNDADQDLVIATRVGIVVMENQAGSQFVAKAKLDLDYDVQSLAIADYDNDGLLDVFACVYRTVDPTGSTFLYRDAVGGGRNRLFRNQCSSSGWHFVDVTSKVGLDDGADRYSLAAAWEDYDNDGDQDLYVANDFGRNHLYQNREGRFVDVAEAAGVLDIGSGMSVSWGDANQDGLMDLYVGNMFSSAGMRVTAQPQFREGESDDVREIYRRLAKGNSLFANRGDGTFAETGAVAGVELGRWAWSSLFVDINNDGREDLLVANGYISTPAPGDL